MDNSWKQDPRLKQMDPQKLELLTQFASRLEHASSDKLIEEFMSVHLDARQKGVQFNDEETNLLITILSSYMAPSERKKINFLRMVSKKLAGTR